MFKYVCKDARTYTENSIRKIRNTQCCCALSRFEESENGKKTDSIGMGITEAIIG